MSDVSPNYKDRVGTMRWLGGFFWLLAVMSLFMFVHQLRIPGSLGALTKVGLLQTSSRVVQLVIFGWGLVQARRWARALLLIYSWFRFGISILTTPAMYWLMTHYTAAN